MIVALRRKLSVAVWMAACLLSTTVQSAPVETSFGGDVMFGGSALLEIELAGTSIGPPTDYDRLLIAGTATLGGTLDVLLLDGFSPSMGDTFQILTTGSVVDMFDEENLPDLGAFVWTTSYSATSVVLEVGSPYTADFDLDGNGDGADFLKWQRGESPDPLSTFDLNLWETQYGMTFPLTAAATTVPEPSCFALLVIAFAAMALPDFRVAKNSECNRARDVLKSHAS